MSSYSIEELISRWKREELTVEQMIGQLLLLMQAQDQRLRELGRRASQREREGAAESS
jgi:hypothetical protein